MAKPSPIWKKQPPLGEATHPTSVHEKSWSASWRETARSARRVRTASMAEWMVASRRALPSAWTSGRFRSACRVLDSCSARARAMKSEPVRPSRTEPAPSHTVATSTSSVTTQWLASCPAAPCSRLRLPVAEAENTLHINLEPVCEADLKPVVERRAGRRARSSGGQFQLRPAVHRVQLHRPARRRAGDRANAAAQPDEQFLELEPAQAECALVAEVPKGFLVGLITNSDGHDVDLVRGLRVLALGGDLAPVVGGFPIREQHDDGALVRHARRAHLALLRLDFIQGAMHGGAERRQSAGQQSRGREVHGVGPVAHDLHVAVAAEGYNQYPAAAGGDRVSLEIRCQRLESLVQQLNLVLFLHAARAIQHQHQRCALVAVVDEGDVRNDSVHALP